MALGLSHPLTHSILFHYLIIFIGSMPILWSHPPVIIHPEFVNIDCVIYERCPVIATTVLFVKFNKYKLES